MPFSERSRLGVLTLLFPRNRTGAHTSHINCKKKGNHSSSSKVATCDESHLRSSFTCPLLVDGIHPPSCLPSCHSVENTTSKIQEGNIAKVLIERSEVFWCVLFYCFHSQDQEPHLYTTTIYCCTTKRVFVWLTRHKTTYKYANVLFR